MHKGPKADIYADHSVDRDERVLATAAVSLLSAPRGILRFSCKPPRLLRVRLRFIRAFRMQLELCFAC